MELDSVADKVADMVADKKQEEGKRMPDMELDMVADKKTIENTRLVCLLLLCELNFLLLIN